ncbi:MAG: hypothetical protein H7A23_15390 [Leptospiraceae bacterium]|nr:hypothetical protein [Leptospiraceae bacterium]MCP5495934.1 hypothetical protein [Leptospiraceae bacterium]
MKTLLFVAPLRDGERISEIFWGVGRKFHNCKNFEVVRIPFLKRKSACTFPAFKLKKTPFLLLEVISPSLFGKEKY